MIHQGQYQLYTDGSYLNGIVGYGAVILKNDEVVAQLSGATDREEYTKSYQVGGEIAAVISGLRWLQEKNVKSVDIFYDFANIEKWATGEYKAKNALSQSYCRLLAVLKIDIYWHKVAAHTGVKWNEMADQLAKKAVADFQLNSAVRNDNLVNDACPVNCLSSNTSPKINELERFIGFLIQRLQEQHIEGTLKKIANGNTAILEIKYDNQLCGHFYIYNTEKKHLSCSLHGIKDVDCGALLFKLHEKQKKLFLAG